VEAKAKAMKIKICGLFREEDILAANEARPDFIGFVFAPSQRQVTREKARSLKEMLAPEIQSVGVFVNAPQEEILSLAEANVIEFIQLHGQETRQYISELKAKTQCPVIKAISVKTVKDIEMAQTMGADFLLLDQGAGGSGKKFSWDIVSQWELLRRENGSNGMPAIPYFLAGGINPGNISKAMETGNPYAVDVSSGAESDGLKDRDKILELVRRVRNESRNEQR